MTIIQKSKQVPYSCEEMYTLVNNVERYAEFLPYCSQSMVHHRDPNEVQATLVISAAGMSKSFTTKNLLQPNKMIEIRLIDGPFQHLEGFWRFDPIEGKDTECEIHFDLEFEFASRLFSSFLNPMFTQLTDSIMDAFYKRAEAIYGPR